MKYGELAARLLERIYKSMVRRAVDCLVFWCVGPIPPGTFLEFMQCLGVVIPFEAEWSLPPSEGLCLKLGRRAYRLIDAEHENRIKCCVCIWVVVVRGAFGLVPKGVFLP